MNQDGFQQDTKLLHIHMISDGTGESVGTLVRSAMALFPDGVIRRHSWTLIRKESHLQRVLTGIRENPGPVFFSMIDRDLSRHLQKSCREIGVSCIDILASVVLELAKGLGIVPLREFGRQYKLNPNYYRRIDAIEFAIAHDDGQGLDTIHKSDVVLVGASRTSKTPICLYLANKGIFAGNIPYVGGQKLPEQLDKMAESRIVGLSIDPRRLAEIRKGRADGGFSHLDQYADLEMVRDEAKEARRIFQERGWKVVDATYRAIEETAVRIMSLVGLIEVDL